MTTHAKNPFKQYWADLWTGIATTVVGMRLTLRYLFKPAVTMEYPEVRPVVPASYRGKHVYDEATCHVCRACAVACPVDCLVIEQLGKGKDAMIVRFEIDYGKCLFCELCTVPCPNGCLSMSEQYDLSATERRDTVIEFARPKSEAELAAHSLMIAQKEAEKKAKAAEAAKAEAAKKEAAAKEAVAQEPPRPE